MGVAGNGDSDGVGGSEAGVGVLVNPAPLEGCSRQQLPGWGGAGLWGRGWGSDPSQFRAQLRPQWGKYAGSRGHLQSTGQVPWSKALKPHFTGRFGLARQTM